jgi:hypothetical protein
MVNLNQITIYNETRALIINTNPLYSFNNGPFPNTGLLMVEKLLAMRKLKQMQLL